jgi:hypothetical protein
MCESLMCLRSYFRDVLFDVAVSGESALGEFVAICCDSDMRLHGIAAFLPLGRAEAC